MPYPRSSGGQSAPLRTARSQVRVLAGVLPGAREMATHLIWDQETPRSTRGHPTAAASPGGDRRPRRVGPVEQTPGSQPGDAGSIPAHAARAPPTRASFNGRTCARQAQNAGSTPAARSVHKGQAPVAQWKRQRAQNAFSPGSNPGGGTARPFPVGVTGSTADFDSAGPGSNPGPGAVRTVEGWPSPVRHRVATPWSGRVRPARVRIARPPRDEVEHGGLCSALIRRRTRFDSWHLDGKTVPPQEDWPSPARQPSRKRQSA